VKKVHFHSAIAQKFQEGSTSLKRSYLKDQEPDDHEIFTSQSMLYKKHFWYRFSGQIRFGTIGKNSSFLPNLGFWQRFSMT
jgi:hypothetical protein